MRLPMNTSLATLKPSGIRRINALAAQHPGCIVRRRKIPYISELRRLLSIALRLLQMKAFDFHKRL